MCSIYSSPQLREAAISSQKFMPTLEKYECLLREGDVPVEKEDEAVNALHRVSPLKLQHEFRSRMVHARFLERVNTEALTTERMTPFKKLLSRLYESGDVEVKSGDDWVSDELRVMTREKVQETCKNKIFSYENLR